MVGTCHRGGGGIALHPVPIQPGHCHRPRSGVHCSPRFAGCPVCPRAFAAELLASHSVPNLYGARGHPILRAGLCICPCWISRDPRGLFHQPSQPLLSGSPALEHVGCMLGVICEPEGAFCPLLRSLLGLLGQVPGDHRGVFPFVRRGTAPCNWPPGRARPTPRLLRAQLSSQTFTALQSHPCGL